MDSPFCASSDENVQSKTPAMLDMYPESWTHIYELG